MGRLRGQEGRDMSGGSDHRRRQLGVNGSRLQCFLSTVREGTRRPAATSFQDGGAYSVGANSTGEAIVCVLVVWLCCLVVFFFPSFYSWSLPLFSFSFSRCVDSAF